MLRQAARLLFLIALLIVPVAVAGAQDDPPPAATPAPAPSRPDAPAAALPPPRPIPDFGHRPPAAPDCGPDLIPYAPPDRSYPMTPNSVMNTLLQNSVLYAGKPTYFDTVFANVGTEVATGTFYVDTWVDDIYLGGYSVTDYPNGFYSWWDDWLGEVETPGWHTLTMWVDYDHFIIECDETNNYWSGNFYWAPVDGWWGTYYNNQELLDDAVFVRDDPEIQFNWVDSSPAPGIVSSDYFSVLWERDFYFPAGTYRFQMSRDDGMRFWIDSNLVLDKWVQGVADHTVIGELTAGTHRLELAANELAGYATAKLSWARCPRLSVSRNPTAGGDVAVSPGGNCNAAYVGGTAVTLTATAKTNYTFSHWSGDASGSTNPLTVTMNNDRNVTANFAPVCYSLNLSANPAAGGDITPDPAPNCAGGKYTPGTVVSLTANAFAGYAFSNYTGDITGTTNPRNITMNGDRSVTANFSPLCYFLYAITDPVDGGQVIANPAPNCGGGKYHLDTIVNLTATANPGYAFKNWSGDITGTTNPRNITMSGDRYVTATFTPACYSLNLHAYPVDGGQVTANPAPNCAGSQYTPGTVVSLTATAYAGYAFDNWTDDMIGPQNPQNITMNGDRVVTAQFEVLNTPVARAVTLPMVLFGALYGFPGPQEVEPNDDWNQANGPLVLNRPYSGYPDDQFDWYYLDLVTTKNLVILLENVTGDDPQLTLFYQGGDPENWVTYAWKEPFTIVHRAPPGRYYVRVYINDDFNTATAYRLQIGAP